MIIDFDAYRRLHPRQCELRFTEEDPRSKLTPDWFRALMSAPDSTRFICPRCPKFWYLGEEDLDFVRSHGQIPRCWQCGSSLWRIYEEQPDISGMVMIIPRPGVESGPSRSPN